MTYRILEGDTREVLKTLPSESVQCCVTSPPYFGLRDYGHDGQIGLEPTPAEYVDALVGVFREVRRVLRGDGTVWLNLGDSYVANATGGPSLKPSLMTGGRANQNAAGERPDKLGFGLAPKNLIGIPWRVAFALQEDGWYLRSDIIWVKPNPMPESVTDRCTKSHEYIFMLSKSADYYYDSDAIKEPASNDLGLLRTKAAFTESADGLRVPQHSPSILKRIEARKIPYFQEMQTGGKENQRLGISEGWRNKRDVWEVVPAQFPGSHFATFPTDLIRPCIRAGCPAGGVVLDPFNGAATTGVVCIEEGRDYIGIEINPEYVAMSNRRLSGTQEPLFALHEGT